MDMRDIIINEILIPSLMSLFKMDYDNIRFGVAERNICARLAFHMENLMRKYDKVHKSSEFRHYYADVEYNRMGNGDKKQYENSEHLPVYMVSDLLIQSRGKNPNYLAIEMKIKGRGTEEKMNHDRDRLVALTSAEPVNRDLPCVYGTLVGAFIVISPKDVSVELFENRDGHGENTENLYFRYDEKLRELVRI